MAGRFDVPVEASSLLRGSPSRRLVQSWVAGKRRGPQRPSGSAWGGGSELVLPSGRGSGRCHLCWRVRVSVACGGQDRPVRGDRREPGSSPGWRLGELGLSGEVGTSRAQVGRPEARACSATGPCGRCCRSSADPELHLARRAAASASAGHGQLTRLCPAWPTHSALPGVANPLGSARRGQPTRLCPAWPTHLARSTAPARTGFT